MSYIQLPDRYVRNNKQVQFNLPSDYEESQYCKEVPHLTNQNPAVENNFLNLLRNREDLKKWLLATSDYVNEIQEDLNAIVGCDEKLNNAIVRHSLDLKDQAIFRNPNPINVTFHDMRKFDLVNPVIGKLENQVKASKLTDYQLTKKLLEQGEIDKLQLRLDGPGLPPPRTPQQEIDDIVRRLCQNSRTLTKPSILSKFYNYCSTKSRKISK